MSVVLGAGASPATQSAIGLAFCAATVAYFAVLEGGAAGATLGKRALGLRVISPDGSPIGYRRGLVRTVARLVSAFPLWAGFLWCLVDDQRRTWHDILARSRVVRVT
jgi:uncharacterized RDD family membrane protein YckC